MTKADVAATREVLAREIARCSRFGGQSHEHLSKECVPGQTYHQRQTILAWPDVDENTEWTHDGDYGTIYGRDHYLRQADDLIDGLSLLGFHIKPAVGG